MRERNYFTKSTTFDIDYLFNKSTKSDSKKKPTNHKFDNEAFFDVKDIVEK